MSKKISELNLTIPSENDELAIARGSNTQKVTVGGVISIHEGVHSHQIVDSFIESKGQNDGVASLDSFGKVPPEQLPSIAISDIYEASSEVTQLALVVQKGDICVRSDENKSYVAINSDNAAITDWKLLKTPVDSILSVDGRTGAVNLSDKYEPKTSSIQTHISDASKHYAINDSAGNGSATSLWSANKIYDELAQKSDNHNHPYAASSHKHLASDLPSGSTAIKGVVQLYDSISSTSSGLAATAGAVKSAYDRGNHSHPYAASSHTHDDRYFTESEVNSKVSSCHLKGDSIHIPYGKNINFGDNSANGTNAIAMCVDVENWKIIETEDSNKVWLEFKDDDGLYVLGGKVYHTGNKPTAAAIGAATASHTHSSFSGDITAANFKLSSDRRLKKNISSLRSVTAQLMDVRPVSFIHCLDESKQVGFIAQELNMLFPELVSDGYEHAGENYLTIAYQNFTAILTKGFQEQQKEIGNLKEELKKTKIEIDNQNIELSDLRFEIESIRKFLKSCGVSGFPNKKACYARRIFNMIKNIIK